MGMLAALHALSLSNTHTHADLITLPKQNKPNLRCRIYVYEGDRRNCVPPTTNSFFPFFCRYLTAVRQAWQVPATTTSLPVGETGGDNLASLYSGLAGVLVAWDPLLDPSIPNHPAVVPVGGINLQPGLMAKVDNLIIPLLSYLNNFLAISLTFLIIFLSNWR